jgi:hypothetical protein
MTDDGARTRRREIQGRAGTSIPDPNISVFINCPFDDEYRPVMDAIVFSTVCCGFLPRSALESGSVAIPRMERIARCVLSSRYSIHDLSRCKGEGDDNLARLNMPLELGIAMGRSLSAKTVDEEHEWLLLVPKGHSYMQFASDLAGYDAKQYEVTPESVVPAVMSWLMTRFNASPGATPKRVLEMLPRFAATKSQLEIEWAMDIPWRELILAARAAASF